VELGRRRPQDVGPQEIACGEFLPQFYASTTAAPTAPPIGTHGFLEPCASREGRTRCPKDGVGGRPVFSLCARRRVRHAGGAVGAASELCTCSGTALKRRALGVDVREPGVDRARSVSSVLNVADVTATLGVLSGELRPTDALSLRRVRLRSSSMTST
jgi:hypothetical protein